VYYSKRLSEVTQFSYVRSTDAVQNNLLQVELQENSYAELIMENEKDKKNGTGPLLSV